MAVRKLKTHFEQVPLKLVLQHLDRDAAKAQMRPENGVKNSGKSVSREIAEKPGSKTGPNGVRTPL